MNYHHNLHIKNSCKIDFQRIAMKKQFRIWITKNLVLIVIYINIFVLYLWIQSQYWKIYANKSGKYYYNSIKKQYFCPKVISEEAYLLPRYIHVCVYGENSTYFRMNGILMTYMHYTWKIMSNRITQFQFHVMAISISATVTLQLLSWLLCKCNNTIKSLVSLIYNYNTFQ